MRVRTLVAAVVVSLVGAGSASAQSDAAARAAIDAANRKFEQAWAAKDAAGLTALYASNATVMPPNAPAASGTAAISALWTQVVGTVPGPLTLKTADIEVHGSTAHERGTWEMKGSDGQAIDAGKYVVIWKKIGGDWKLYDDIWNSDRPPAGM